MQGASDLALVATGDADGVPLHFAARIAGDIAEASQA